MKLHLRLFVVLSAFLAVSVGIPSAHAAGSPEGLGLHLGLNFADVSADTTADTSSTTGFEVGATYDYSLADGFFFVPGAQIIQRGFGVDVPAPLREVDIHVTYLEFPLLFQARFTGAGANLIPFFTAGPNFGLKLGTSCSVSGGECTVTDESGVKTLTMGFEFGGGAIFPLENAGSLMAQIRYHLGLTNVTDSPADPKNRGLLLDVGYLF